MTSDVLRGLALRDLEKLCHLVFWLGIGGDREMSWGETREQMEGFLASVPPDVVGRYREFLAVEDEVTVPDDHRIRIANLPAVVRNKARDVAPLLFQEEEDEDLELEQALSEDESELLLRWATWTGDIPRRAVWWYTPPGERPAP